MMSIREIELSLPPAGSELWRVRAVVYDGPKTKHVDLDVANPWELFDALASEIKLKGQEFLGEEIVKAAANPAAYIETAKLPF